MRVRRIYEPDKEAMLAAVLLVLSWRPLGAEPANALASENPPGPAPEEQRIR